MLENFDIMIIEGSTSGMLENCTFPGNSFSSFINKGFFFTISNHCVIGFHININLFGYFVLNTMFTDDVCKIYGLVALNGIYI